MSENLDRLVVLMMLQGFDIELEHFQILLDNQIVHSDSFCLIIFQLN
jgi:hypothetical protein